MKNELVFSATHEWVQWLSETEALVGISNYAAEQLGDIVYVDIDAEDVEVKDVLGDIESVKAVSDFYSPVTGDVVEINQAVVDNPALINEDSEKAWICKIANITDTVELLSKKEYDALDKD